MKRILATIFLYLTICAPAFCTEFLEVSLIRVISNPDLFDGKKIRVSGFLHLEYEGDALYVHRDDATYSLRKNGISINLDDQKMSKWARLNDHYVVVEGQFLSGSKGHMDLSSGVLQNITRVDERPGPRKRAQ